MLIKVLPNINSLEENLSQHLQSDQYGVCPIQVDVRELRGEMMVNTVNLGTKDEFFMENRLGKAAAATHLRTSWTSRLVVVLAGW